MTKRQVGEGRKTWLLRKRVMAVGLLAHHETSSLDMDVFFVLLDVISVSAPGGWEGSFPPDHLDPDDTPSQG